MKLLLVVCISVFSVFLSASGGAAEPREAEPPARFDKYYMVFLVRPEAPVRHGEERDAELQRQHLGHLQWLWEQGHALVAGPFGGDTADRMRGIVLLRGDLSPERARELTEMDPRVQAGQLEVEVREWFTGAGMLTFPKQPAAE